MSDRVFRQPDGRYAVFSSVVDGFTMFNCTAENVVTYYVERAAIEAKRQAAQAIERADTASYMRLGPQSWDEGVQAHDRHHPDDPVSAYVTAAPSADTARRCDNCGEPLRPPFDANNYGHFDPKAQRYICAAPSADTTDATQ